MTKEMLGVPKYYFLLTGMCEATASLLMLICTSRLPGVILPVLSQLFTVWQMVLSILLLGRKCDCPCQFSDRSHGKCDAGILRQK